MPDAPQQETTFLAFPKAGKQVLGREAKVGMAPGVVVFEQVIGNNIEQGNKDAGNGSAVYYKTIAAEE